MAVQKLTIEEFVKLAKEHPVLDVRSPGEYNHAHMPGAYSLPLFTDEERKMVGTAYKQQSREAAIKVGLDYFGVKMKTMVEETEFLVSRFSLNSATSNQTPVNEQQETRNVLVHCWRGGMRSAGVAWLLDLYGFNVYTLVGGYKSYRKWVLAQFEKDYNFNIIGGYTGSGKTLLLHELKMQHKKIIDLELLANHKGSAGRKSAICKLQATRRARPQSPLQGVRGHLPRRREPAHWQPANTYAPMEYHAKIAGIFFRYTFYRTTRLYHK